MLKNNKERKAWIENEDNYEVTDISEVARYKKSRPLDDGSKIIIFEVKEKNCKFNYETRKYTETTVWSVIGMFITAVHNEEPILESTSISDIVSRMTRMK